MPEKVKVTIRQPFMYNGTLAKVGDVVDMYDERAYNHMRAGDVERDEAIIATVRQRRLAAAEAAHKNASESW